MSLLEFYTKKIELDITTQSIKQYLALASISKYIGELEYLALNIQAKCF